MKLTEILKKDFIIADLKGKDKESILEELTGFLKDRQAVEDKDALHAALVEREKLGSTGIGENVAIPHAKSAEVSQIMTLFGRSVGGIDFDSLDNKPVHFVCLVLAPVQSTGHHLKALARISRLLKVESLRSGILQAENEDQIYSILVEEDAKFI